jgi:8-oxo-dGTP pyrophosphatase MutT (NUDIX family)
LLIYHKKLDKWLQPGGHADGEEDLHKVAKSELEEETGVVNSDYLARLSLMLIYMRYQNSIKSQNTIIMISGICLSLTMLRP